MKKTLMIAAAVATLATGFSALNTTTAEAGGWWKYKKFHFVHVPKCKVKYYDPYWGWKVKWVPCRGYY